MMLTYYEIMQFCILFLEYLALLIFIYYVTKYLKKQGDLKDWKTILTFIFIILTLSVKLIPYTVLMIYIILNYDTDILIYYRDHSADNAIICTINVSLLASRLLFKLAFIINTMRWLFAIEELKNGENKQRNIRRIRILFAVSIIVFVLTLLFNLIDICEGIDADADEILEVL